MDYDKQEQLDLFSGALWLPGDLIEIRCFGPEKGPRSFWLNARDLPKRAAELEALSQKQYGIYAGVLPRTERNKRTAEYCQLGHALWLDFDGPTPGEASAKIQSAGLPEPTMIVFSGHGTHCYFGLQTPVESAALVALAKDLAALVGSDPAVSDAARVMRLPGFMNWKDPSALACLVECEPGRRYDFNKLRAIVPVAIKPRSPCRSIKEEAKRDSGDSRPIHGQDAVLRAEKYIAAIPGAAEGTRNHEGYRVAAKLVCDFSLPEEEARPILERWANRCTPPLDQGEVDALLKSAARSAKGEPGSKLTALPREEQRHPAQVPEYAPPPGDPAKALRAEIDDERTGRTRGIYCPDLKILLEASKGLRPGSLTVLGGREGSAKTWLELSILCACIKHNLPWQLMSFEMTQLELLRRFVAVADRSFDAVDVAADGATDEERKRFADLAEAAIERHSDIISRAGKSLILPGLDRPRERDWRGVLAWAKESMANNRIVAIDSYTFVDFPGKDPWKEQSAFIAGLKTAAQTTKATCLLIAHLNKPLNPKAPPTADDLQGSQFLKRAADAIILVWQHEKTESTVQKWGGIKQKIEHGMTIIVRKGRHGKLRPHLAYLFGEHGPAFQELGVILPKGGLS